MGSTSVPTSAVSECLSVFKIIATIQKVRISIFLFICPNVELPEWFEIILYHSNILLQPIHYDDECIQRTVRVFGKELHARHRVNAKHSAGELNDVCL